MAAQYGRTWWGEQWLRALDRIDFSNRLPRGRSYAKKGMVKSIQITENRISARVQGSRPRPYEITIIVPPFADAEKKLLLEAVKHDPLMVSRLLNRQLPEELLEIAGRRNIKVFPQSWQDLKLNCSCPDWAVPCKHLAAVIYTVANEIDQNPFLVFQLHDFDLVRELASHKIQLGELEKEHIFSIHDCVGARPVAHAAKPTEAPDFSQIENLLPTLPPLFTANPLFYQGDFRSVIQSHYKRHAKYEQTFLSELKSSRARLPNEYRYYNYQLTAHADGSVAVAAVSPDNAVIDIDKKDLLALLAQTESKHLGNYPPSFVLLYRAFRFCNILAERGALLPRLFDAGNGRYRIQWIPALINDSVKKVFDDLLQWYPPGLLQISRAPKAGGKKSAKSKSTPATARPQEALLLLCGFFATTSVKACYRGTWRTEKTSGKMERLFFDDEPCVFEGFSEKEIPNTIQLWLSRFYISKRAFSPVLQVHERNGAGFEVEVLMKDNTAPLQPVEPLQSFMQGSSDVQFAALKDLQLLTHYLPDLNRVIGSKGSTSLRYSNQTFAEVLTGILPAIRMLGVQTLLPKSLQHILKPQVTVAIVSKGKNKKYFSLTDLLDYNWQVALGNTLVNKEEFLALAGKSAGLVKIRDQYVMMSGEEIERVIKKLNKPSVPDSFALLQAALSGDYEGAPVRIDAAVKEKINELLAADNTPLPGALQANLRPYQQRGFNWLYKNAQLGLGSVLADDMGLGKTLQVITALQKFREEGKLEDTPALVIAPTTLLSNWQAEIKRFAPALTTTIFHGAARQAKFKGIDVVITTYGIARAENEKLCKQKWYTVIIDEAQNIKNTETAQTKAVKKIQAPVKIAMSGTPVENRLMEYWSIFDFANPGYLGNANWFDAEYARPIEINQDRKRLDKFRSITSPFVMRRVKTDKSIISDLPDKVENNQICSLTKEQAALYKNITQDLMQEVEYAQGISRRGLVLKLLTLLKQVCNHPVQYLKNGADVRPEQSGKMMLLLQLLETIYENGEKVLIFSQYQEMGGLLRKVIHEHFGKKALQLHGGNTRRERDEMVQAFQHTALNDTFILSLKAGGTGLNLTAGNHVIHYDLWWNPAVEAQATDRAFRIGQRKNVMVHRMITKGTLEEKIDDMLRSKKQLASLTVSQGEKWIGELSDTDLRQLVALGE
jgi:uncharacterized Zn finger protein/superfamily II DNA or RNA helicase